MCGSSVPWPPVMLLLTVFCVCQSLGKPSDEFDSTGSSELVMDIVDKDSRPDHGRSWRTLPLLPSPSLSLSHSPARLRHSRHLLGRGSANSPHLPTAEALLGSNLYNLGTGQTTTQDNHKPVFTNCSLYHPSVREEEAAGTFVFRVTATDRDPPENGGSITYALVTAPNDRPKFSIDNTTGEIRTIHMFDRDEPYREKEEYLTVRATDNGNPQLDDVCTIKVTIEDINDNTPVFDKVNYQESVPQDLKPDNEVMRISATDIDDGNNSRVIYGLEARVPGDAKYFHVDKTTGVIYLDREIDKEPGYHFRMRATATDQGEVPSLASIDLEILVVESHKKAPTFTTIPASPIYLREDMSNYSYNIATFTAESNTDEKAPVFELVIGQTDQTNKQNMFRLESEGKAAHIRLARHLDFEYVSEYLLTIRIQNKYSLAAETTIKIQLEDVNDKFPTFIDGQVSGQVLENEPPGTPVMKVQAIDYDSTSANNQVTYELADNQENFAIDRNTGNITTLKTFDREEKDVYNVKVIAWDNSPSALFSTGVHNHAEQVFRIVIADKNDHPPKFTQERYVAEAIPEDANNNALVTEVKAIDNDTASTLTYSIVEGNIDNAFLIEPKTGRITVNGQLDYENITSYTLKVRAFDGIYEDYAHVDIKIENVNDNPPVFYPYKNNITLQEEYLEPGCIAELRAYDPDIPDRNEPQHIVYSVVSKQDQQKYLTISNNGCLSLLKPLDRDPPKGHDIWQVFIQASDNDATPQNTKALTTEVVIKLLDINDNAPFLDMPKPVVWQENKPPGNIVQLKAKDNDGPENGGPFKFQIASSASLEIQSKFGVSGDKLTALTTFDREEKKSYQVLIAVTDSGIPPMTGISTLTVTIGDENDNPMKKGSSNIFVYNYKGEAPDTEIGRVYVDDLDDWDLPDKNFRWANKSHQHFDLSDSTGMITMLQGTPEGSYLLEFLVTEESHLIQRHTVEATVNVTVKEIPEEAVDKSGSIRFYGTSAEDFISPDSHGLSKRSMLQAKLSHMLNTSLENVDVFTVLHSIHTNNETLLDVRFSAHGSPYYAPEKINQAITNNWADLERVLGTKILMVNIDECLQEMNHCGDSSCSNFLKKNTVPVAVYTNTTSFVGVEAIVYPLCTCNTEEKIVCHNGGTLIGNKCDCMEGFEGPHCEILAVGFHGDGWALYPSFPPCEDSHLSLELQSYKQDGLVFYIGPTNPHSYHLIGVQDFMSLEIREGYPLLLVDYGTGTVKIPHNHIKVSDGALHRIDIIWSKTSIELQVDKCRLLPCLSLTAPTGTHKFLNVNGPLQLGGTHMKLASVAQGMNWTYRPQDNGFSGCIRNLTFNQKLYNLGMPSVAKNADPGCNENNMAEAISFGINSSFIIAVLICLASLLILLLAVVVHRKKTDDMYKDTDDIRENIINYEDEGGGEGDMTGYDLNVLRLMYDDPLNEKQMPNNTHLIQRPDDVPDICGFLDGKKQSVDNDPETNPFDDVRHYAYEGDGNTTGSLSSLASGTDEGDLNFDYLSNFGPRFRKLADMYGEDPSDEEDDNFHNAASESWC